MEAPERQLCDSGDFSFLPLGKCGCSQSQSLEQVTELDLQTEKVKNKSKLKKN